MFKSLSFSLKEELKEAVSLLRTIITYRKFKCFVVLLVFFKSEKQSISPKGNYSVPTSNPQYCCKYDIMLQVKPEFYISFSHKLPKRQETEISFKIRNLKVGKSSHNFKPSNSYKKQDDVLLVKLQLKTSIFILAQ